VSKKINHHIFIHKELDYLRYLKEIKLVLKTEKLTFIS